MRKRALCQAVGDAVDTWTIEINGKRIKVGPLWFQLEALDLNRSRRKYSQELDRIDNKKNMAHEAVKAGTYWDADDRYKSADMKRIDVTELRKALHGLGGFAAAKTKRPEIEKRNSNMVKRAKMMLEAGTEEHELVGKLERSSGLTKKHIRNILRRYGIIKKREIH